MPSNIMPGAELTDIRLTEEAFTSENWIVRIFAVKKEDDIGRQLPDVSAFDGGVKLRKTPSAKTGSKRKN